MVWEKKVAPAAGVAQPRAMARKLRSTLRLPGTLPPATKKRIAPSLPATGQPGRSAQSAARLQRQHSEVNVKPRHRDYEGQMLQRVQCSVVCASESHAIGRSVMQRSHVACGEVEAV